MVAGDILTVLVGLAALANRHEIGAKQNASSGLECGLQDVCAFQVATGRGQYFTRLNRTIADLAVSEDFQEESRTVEVRQARPVDRPGRADEGCRMHVSNDSVVADWPVHCFSVVRLQASGR